MSNDQTNPGTPDNALDGAIRQLTDDDLFAHRTSFWQDVDADLVAAAATENTPTAPTATETRATETRAMATELTSPAESADLAASTDNAPGPRRWGKPLAAVIGVAAMIAAAFMIPWSGADGDAITVGVAATAPADDGAEADPSPDTANAAPADSENGDTEPADGGTPATADVAPTGDAAESTAIRIGLIWEFSHYNNELSMANSPGNIAVLNEVLPRVFRMVGPRAEPQLDTELFDSVQVLAEVPLVVEYAINPAAVWSDGDPIDCREFLFRWRTHTAAAPSPFDITDTAGYDAIEAIECADNDTRVTVRFRDGYADWRGLFNALLPSHIVEQGSGVADFVAAFDTGDQAAIGAMADFFVNRWTLATGGFDTTVMPSGGKYQIVAQVPGVSLTLRPNPTYWGSPAHAALEIRPMDPMMQTEALAAGDVDVIAPPSPALGTSVDQLRALDGAVVDVGSELVWEQFMLNLASGTMSNREVREAFALCVPREQMTGLVRSVNPDAQLVNNRLTPSTHPGYVDTTGGAYDQVDLGRAQELLDASGVSQPVDVRIGWFDIGNQRRSEQVAMTIASCNQIGFNVVNAGSPTFFESELGAGDWDVAMFAFSGPLTTVERADMFGSDGTLNFGGYSNTAVDQLLDELVRTPDLDRQISLGNEIDALLWQDLISVPVFNFPGLVAYRSDLAGVVRPATAGELTANASEWSLN